MTESEKVVTSIGEIIDRRNNGWLEMMAIDGAYLLKSAEDYLENNRPELAMKLATRMKKIFEQHENLSYVAEWANEIINKAEKEILKRNSSTKK